MKTTLRIARLELSTLFYSPIAWFLLVVFLFQCGLEYTSLLDDYVTSQEIYGHLEGIPYLTSVLFGYPYGMLPVIVGKLYLYLPLLTMSLMSREISSGTIKLLYSSPIRVREIVFGKFLAMMVYCFLLTLILALLAGTALIYVHAADYRLLLSALLGIYILLCAYSAIGIFMSCLTSYQVVAALSTLVVFAVLGYIGTVGQQFDFVRDLTYFLSIAGRTNHMLAGLISTKDLIYFGIIVSMFLGFSIYKLQSGRESTSWLVKAGRFALIIVAGLAVGYITSRPGLIGYYDATATKTNTLTANTQKIVKEMGDEPLEVTSYINLFQKFYYYGEPTQRNVDMDRWEPYLRFKPGIKFNYVYYYDDNLDNHDLFVKSNPGMSLQAIAEKYARAYKIDLDPFKTPAQIGKIIDLKPELNRYVMNLTFRGKSTFLRLFDDNKVFPSETETSAAIKRLTVKLPKIAFLDGELERSIDKVGDKDYKFLTSVVTFRYALINQGFDVETVLPGQPIPGDIAALVIADPRTNFTPEVLTRIRAYIDGGGNMLIAGEPGKQAILNPLLKPLGIQLADGIVVQESNEFSPDLVLPHLTDTAAGFSPAIAKAFKDSVAVSMRGVAALSYGENGPYDIKPLLVSDGKITWNKMGALVLDSAKVLYSPADGDVKGAMATAVRLTRKIRDKEQRIIVLGDADLMSNSELGRRNVKTANFAFNTALFGWFTYGQFPIDTSRPEPEDTKINMSGAGVTRMKIIFLGLLPGLLLILGTILLIRRKRK